MIGAGAGMAGLVAAARACELGASPVVLEKGDRPGGSLLLSSGVVWRHHSLEDFHAECPGGEWSGDVSDGLLTVPQHPPIEFTTGRLVARCS